MGSEPIELVLVELKDATDTATDEQETGPDPTVVAPDHYSVEFENDKVRAIRIKYGPGETSVMHYHPDSVAVFFDDLQGQFELPDGSTQDMTAEAGQAIFTPAGQHRPSNVGDKPFELNSDRVEVGAWGGARTSSEHDLYLDSIRNDARFDRLTRRTQRQWKRLEDELARD